MKTIEYIMRGCIRPIAVLGILLMFLGCSSMPKRPFINRAISYIDDATEKDYWAIRGKTIKTMTGKYVLIRASPAAVNNVFDSRAGELIRLGVESFAYIPSRMGEIGEIWYTDTSEIEEKNVRSYRDLIEAHKRDKRTAFEEKW